jgi:hypothetical protein
VPASVRTELVGAKEAVRSLNKIEPGLRKQFAAEATQIAQPAIEEAASRYQALGVPLSGMNRNWTNNGRKIFPFSVNKAVRGLKVRVEGDRRKTGVILLEQRDVAAAVFEGAGRANANSLGNSLGQLSPGRTRILGPSLYKRQGEVTKEMEKAVLAVIDRVNKELR